MSEARDAALILGIGNLLWADEGFGVRCIEALHRGWVPAPGARLLDGGTQGLYLVHEVGRAERLLVFDAIDYGERPGTLKIVRGDEVPRFTGVRKLSLHQTGFQEVLAAASLLGRAPSELVLVGVQSANLDDYGGSLSAEVAAQLEPALEHALGELAGWGLPFVARTDAVPSLLGPGLDRRSYESGRPDEKDACRSGDARFL